MQRQLPLLQKASIYLKGIWGVFAIGLFISGGFSLTEQLQDYDFDEDRYLTETTAVGTGEITAVFETEEYVDLISIYGYEYVFHSSIGDLDRISYALGIRHKVGDEVEIEFSKERPAVNRIMGMSNNLTNLSAILGIAIGAIGIIILFILGRRKIGLIESGEITMATLTKKKKTLFDLNDEPLYKMTFKYKAKDGITYTLTTKTITPKRLEDEKREFLFYHPENPKKALMLDKLPNYVTKYIRKNWSETLKKVKP